MRPARRFAGIGHHLRERRNVPAVHDFDECFFLEGQIEAFVELCPAGR